MGTLVVLNSFSRTVVRSCVVGAVALVGMTSVYAMRVSPMIVEMTTTGTDSVARVEVQNLNAGRLPFETKITRLSFDENGKPSESPADNEFLVFPPQGMLPQGARQVIRLQWVGKPDIATSEAFYLSVNQLPIPVEPGAAAQNAQVQVVYHMKALVVVAPPNAQPDVTVKSVERAPYQPPAEKQGGPLPPTVPGIAVTMQNDGHRHMMMSAVKWVFIGTAPNGKPVRYVATQEDISRVVGSGYIAGNGGRRIFRFPVGSAFGPGPISVKFSK